MIPRKVFSFFTFLLAALLGVALLLFPHAAAEGFSVGMNLCLNSVLPALFPFMVVCNLLAACPFASALGLPLRPLALFCGLKSRSAPLVLALSWFGGYAVCAQSIRQHRVAGLISQREAALLLLLGCCSGPGFVIGCVGGLLLNSVQLGVLLYFLQIAANFLSAACLWPFYRPRSVSNLTDTPGVVEKSVFSFPDAISQAVNSSLLIVGCLVFFQVVSSLMVSLFSGQNSFLQLLFRSIFEISSGCAACAQLGGIVGLRCIAACLSLLGLSVFAQIATLLKGTAPFGLLVVSRILHLFWMQALLRLVLRYLPGVAAAYSSIAPRLVIMNRARPDAALLLFAFICAILYKLTKTTYNKRQAGNR